MLSFWNNLPSSVKDAVRLLVVLILGWLQSMVQHPPTVNVTTPAPVVNVVPSPVVFSGQPPAAK